MTESTQPNNENEPDNIFNKTDWADVFKIFLGTDKYEKTLLTFEKNKEADVQLKKDEHLANLTFWKWKFIKEFFTVFIIIGVIFCLAIFCKIENSTLGTLLGSIIGYSIGNFNSSKNNH